VLCDLCGKKLSQNIASNVLAYFFTTEITEHTEEEREKKFMSLCFFLRGGFMKFRFIKTNDPEYVKEKMLRWENLRKPLGLPPGSEVIPEDKDSLHFVAFDKKDLVGCVLFHPESAIKGRLFQMTISEEYRGQGFGRKLIATLEHFLNDKGYQEVYLYAREDSLGFYKQMGYHAEEETIEIVHLPHRLMRKQLVKKEIPHGALIQRH